jgi:NADH dehydrogenase FAD-containing subunit
MRFFEEQQERIKAAHHIIIVGAGAAGVEIAGDIKSQYPQKKVTLIHSREQLLNNFGPGLHDRAKSALEELGVELYLGQRVISGLEGDNPTEVTIQSGKVLQCDALVGIFRTAFSGNLLTTFTD